MICAVFTNNRKKAQDKLEEIKNIKCNLVRLYNSKNGLEYEFADGEIWRWVCVSQHQRGIRAYKAWIDKDIDTHALCYDVFPSCDHCNDEDMLYF